MFMLNDSPLALDTAFTHNEIQYPANWLRLSTPEERAEIGITEIDEPESYDDRFYWGVGNPKDVEMVRSMLSAQIKRTSYNMLSPTDYKLIRKVETDEAADQATLDLRAAIRAAYADNAAMIAAATTTAELASIQFTWPSEGE
jgi:hypothetical protein